MTIADSAAELGQITGPARRVTSFFKRCWGAFQERRERDRVRAALNGLEDSELRDIGISRGEVDYVASHRSIDPRGIRSAG
jgi:uncharacterized protein YjiS (DUF1127 family)